MPYTMSVTRSLRAEASVCSCRSSANSIATADTSVKAQRWWRKAKSVDMVRMLDRRPRKRQPVQLFPGSILVVGIAPAGVLFQAGQPDLDGLLFLAARSGS